MRKLMDSAPSFPIRQFTSATLATLVMIEVAGAYRDLPQLFNLKNLLLIDELDLKNPTVLFRVRSINDWQNSQPGLYEVIAFNRTNWDFTRTAQRLIMLQLSQTAFMIPFTDRRRFLVERTRFDIDHFQRQQIISLIIFLVARRCS